MGKQHPSDGRCDPPSEVRITVLQDPGDRRLWKPLQVKRGIRYPRRRHAALLAVVAVAAVGAIGATMSSSSSPHASHPPAHAGAPTVAVAYGYPSRCLSVTISSIDPAFARADFNHASPCGRYAGYPTAIFHLVDRAWRPVLEAVSYPCPATGIPPAVQRELDVCPAVTRSRRPR